MKHFTKSELMTKHIEWDKKSPEEKEKVFEFLNDEDRKKSISALDTLFRNNPNSEDIVIEDTTPEITYQIDEGVMSSLLKVAGFGIASYLANKFISSKADPKKHGSIKSLLMKNLPLIISGVGLATIKSDNSLVVGIAKITGLAIPAVVTTLKNNKNEAVNESLNQAIYGTNIESVNESQIEGNGGKNIYDLYNNLSDLQRLLFDTANLKSDKISLNSGVYTVMPCGKTIYCKDVKVADQISHILTLNNVEHGRDESKTLIKMLRTFSFNISESAAQSYSERRVFNMNESEEPIDEKFNNMGSVLASVKRANRGSWKSWIPALQSFGMTKEKCSDFIRSCGYGKKATMEKMTKYWNDNYIYVDKSQATIKKEKATTELVSKWFMSNNIAQSRIVIELLKDNKIVAEHVANSKIGNKTEVRIDESFDLRHTSVVLSALGLNVESCNVEKRTIIIDGLNK